MKFDVERELEGCITEYEDYKAKKVQEFKDLQKHGYYADKGLEAKAAEIEKELTARLEACAGEFSRRAANMAKRFSDTYGKRPDKYDVKLNTAITLITTIGDGAVEAEYKEWLEPFKYDYKSMLTFSKVIKTDFRHTLKAYEVVPEIIQKLEQVAENPKKYFSAPSVYSTGATAGAGTAVNGERTINTTSLTFVFLCSGLQAKIDKITEFIEAF